MDGTMWLFLIFVIIPVLEITLFIQVGGFFGLWPTLAIVVLTALIGTTLMRIQGMQAMARLRETMQKGDNPGGHIAHGALILVSGVLLLTPGFFTDILGLLLLVPTIRDMVIRWGAGRVTMQSTTFVHPQNRKGTDHSSTIDAEYEIIDEPPNVEPGDSGWTKPPKN